MLLRTRTMIPQCFFQQNVNKAVILTATKYFHKKLVGVMIYTIFKSFAIDYVVFNVRSVLTKTKVYVTMIVCVPTIFIGLFPATANILNYNVSDAI